MPRALRIFYEQIFELHYDEEPDYGLLKMLLKGQLRKHESRALPHEEHKNMKLWLSHEEMHFPDNSLSKEMITKMQTHPKQRLREKDKSEEAGE